MNYFKRLNEIDGALGFAVLEFWYAQKTKDLRVRVGVWWKICELPQLKLFELSGMGTKWWKRTQGWVDSQQWSGHLDLTYCFYDTDKSSRSSNLVTLLLHLARSLASSSASSTVRRKILQSSLTVNQRFFGLPTSLFPCTLPYTVAWC